jgi:hypothetical protein
MFIGGSDTTHSSKNQKTKTMTTRRELINIYKNGASARGRIGDMAKLVFYEDRVGTVAIGVASGGEFIHEHGARVWLHRYINEAKEMGRKGCRWIALLDLLWDQEDLLTHERCLELALSLCEPKQPGKDDDVAVKAKPLLTAAESKGAQNAADLIRKEHERATAEEKSSVVVPPVDDSVQDVKPMAKIYGHYTSYLSNQASISMQRLTTGKSQSPVPESDSKQASQRLNTKTDQVTEALSEIVVDTIQVPDDLPDLIDDIPQLEGVIAYAKDLASVPDLDDPDMHDVPGLIDPVTLSPTLEATEALYKIAMVVKKVTGADSRTLLNAFLGTTERDDEIIKVCFRLARAGIAIEEIARIVRTIEA